MTALFLWNHENQLSEKWPFIFVGFGLDNLKPFHSPLNIWNGEQQLSFSTI